MPGQTRILIVEDNDLFRSILAAYLRQEASFEVVGEARDGLSGVAMAEQTTPDVIIMDVRIPGEIDGVEATRRIVAARAEAKIIGFSSEIAHRAAMLAAGAAAFVGKEQTQDLIARIKSLAAA